MTSQISGPCCNLDIEPTWSVEEFLWESHIRQQFSLSLNALQIGAVF